MTKTFATDKNNDLFLGPDGNLVMDTGVLATRDICKGVAETRLGELIFDVTDGIPYFQAIWVGTPNLPQFEAALLNALQSVPGVVRVLDLAVSKDKNILNYTAVVLTNLGEVTVNGSV